MLTEVQNIVEAERKLIDDSSEQKKISWHTHHILGRDDHMNSLNRVI